MLRSLFSCQVYRKGSQNTPDRWTMCFAPMCAIARLLANLEQSQAIRVLVCDEWQEKNRERVFSWKKAILKFEHQLA